MPKKIVKIIVILAGSTSALIALIFIIIGGVLFFFAVGQHLLDLSIPWLLLIQLINWLPFVLFIRHHCYRGDLKLNGH